MYRIDQPSYGYRYTFDGFMKADEAQRWATEAVALLKTPSTPFHVFADLRTMKPMPDETREIVIKVQQTCRARGMVRSVVVVSSQIASMQLKHIAQETGIYKWERYIDSSSDPKWEAKAIAWLEQGTDPDK